MLFSTLARNSLLQQGRQQLINGSRRASSASSGSALSQWYKTFGSSNIAYVGFIMVGLVTTEVLYGFTTDAIWDSVNNGKTFESVDWSKFVVEDDDDEEEEEEEDDD